MALGDIKWKPGEMGSETFSIKVSDGCEHSVYVLVKKYDYVVRCANGEFIVSKPEYVNAVIEMMTNDR